MRFSEFLVSGIVKEMYEKRRTRPEQITGPVVGTGRQGRRRWTLVRPYFMSASFKRASRVAFSLGISAPYLCTRCHYTTTSCLHHTWQEVHLPSAHYSGKFPCVSTDDVTRYRVECCFELVLLVNRELQKPSVDDIY